MPLILPGNVASTTAATGFDVDNSCRLDGTSSYMHKTPDSNSNRYTWTWSGWVKRSSNLAAQQTLFGVSAASGSYHLLSFDANALLVHNYEGTHLTTTATYRDVSAWYHIVLAVDTTQSTDTNRLKLYVNGTQVTSFSNSGYPPEDEQMNINRTVQHDVGNAGTSYNYYFSGYMAEVVFIDGLALAPTSFGEFDSDSPTIWKPIDVSGLTFGTNGFYLDFKASDNLGNDANGGTDLTEVNLAATDQSTDTCTNNFATFNPLVKPAAAIPLSEGNLKGVFPGSWTALPATFGLTKGKWYFEAKNITSGQNAFIGVVTENQKWDDGTPYNETTGVVLFGPGGRKTVDNTSNDGFFATLSSGQIVGVALNLDSSTKTIQFSVNGTDTPNSTPVDLPSTFDDVFIFPYFIGNSSSETSNWELNFGSPPYSESGGNSDGDGFGNFKTAPPSGHFALCTKNLAEYG